MPRWMLLPLALLLAMLALVFFMANKQVAEVDFYFTTFSLPIGLLLPLALFIGCLIGGMVLIAAVIVPLRLRLRAQTRELESFRQQRETP
jgi:uncharacterized integral membrane protein